MGVNVYSQKWHRYIGVWAMQWKNPNPAKPIQKIILQSAGTAVPVIFGITLSDQDFYSNQATIKKDFHRPDGPPDGYFKKKEDLEHAGMLRAADAAGYLRGIRAVELIRPDLLAVTVDGALANIGAGIGAGIIEREQVPEVFTVTAAGGASVKPVKVGRHSYEYWNGDIGTFPQSVLYWHTFYLQLPEALKPGQAYQISVRDLAGKYQHVVPFTFNPASVITPVIKINQVAYFSKAQQHYAYLGWWAGDLGKVDYHDLKNFEVIDDATGQKVAGGEIKLRQADDPASGEDVYEMDLSGLVAGKKYHVAIPGFARSDSFGVGSPGIHQLYYDTMRAFFHQRTATELSAKYTDFPRPAAFVKVYESGYMVGNPSYVPKPNEPTRDYTGGYNDAGNFNVVSMHLRATSQMLLAYEAFPKAFKDGDLHIPESGNGIPDVLDEADWALFFYRDSQREDGAIYSGRGNDQDHIRELEHRTGTRPKWGLLDPTNSSASEFAAVAAQFSRLIQPYDAAKAAKYLASAKKAYAWAKMHPDAKPDRHNGDEMFLAYAASELFKTTGEPQFNQEFLTMYKAGALVKVDWSLGWVAWLPRWSYLSCTRPEADAAVQKELLQMLTRDAAGEAERTQKNAYRNGWDGRAAGWGSCNGGGMQSLSSMLMYIKTGDRKYLETVSLNADFQLGANAQSKTFITGMGARPPVHPEINPLLYKGPNRTGATVPGITIYGIGCGKLGWNETKSSYPTESPSYWCWRDLGNGGAEVSSEFTITETIGNSAMLYGFLYALDQ
jgi:endoglucanase